MADQDKTRWTRWVSDFETSDLSQREFAQARGGDSMLRCSLVEAAHALMNRCRKSSNLRAWALQLKARVGTKKAAVAVARKLCGIMWSMWMKETDFRRV
jgi:hypothetical protein